MKKNKKKLILNHMEKNDVNEDYGTLNKFFKKSVACTLAAVLGVSATYLYGEHYKKVTHRPIANAIFNFKDVTLDDVNEKIYSSNLIDDQKDYLYNEQFFNDILPYVNSNQVSKFKLDKKLNNVNINIYGWDWFGKFAEVAGYYYPLTYNTININGKYSSDIQHDTIPHEFIHLCQDSFEYNLISEACAEIMAYEYYDTCEDAYYAERYLVKKLMEIIGPDPVKEYCFTGCFESIEEELRKYLTNSEYNEILPLFKMKTTTTAFYNEEEENKNKGKLNDMLDMIYERKNGCRSNVDPAINNINSPNMVRYYFNTSKMDKQHSFLITEHSTMHYMPIKQALESGLIDLIVKNVDNHLYYYSYDDFDEFTYEDGATYTCLKSNDRNLSVHLDEEGNLYALTNCYVGYLTPINEKYEKEEVKTLKLN